MSKRQNIFVGIMLCFILLASVRNHSMLSIGVGPVFYCGGFTLTALAFYSFYKNERAHTITYIAPILYIVWALLGIFRGMFEITSAWVFNQYLHGILSVMVPVIIFLFALPDTIIRSFQIFNIFTVVYSFLSFGWNYNMEAYCFAFSPFYYFYLAFITKIPKKWIFITLIAVAFVLLAYTNRSAFVKVLMSVLVLIIFLLPQLIQKVTLNVIHWLLYVVPVILLFLGLTGQYNVFRGGYLGNNDDFKIVVGNNGFEVQKNTRRTDTRTFIYEEVLTSMVVNNYVFAGRTPARGYYSPYFAPAEENVNIPGKIYGERISCEVGHLNTLNWLGIIGLLLITFVFFQGSCLALYRSNNIYVKCLSLEVAFMWMWGWVENSNNFHMLDVMIYVLLAICYSPNYREMTNLEFQMWFRSIFQWPGEKLHDYNKYLLTKNWLSKRLAN